MLQEMTDKSKFLYSISKKAFLSIWEFIEKDSVFVDAPACKTIMVAKGENEKLTKKAL